MAFLDVVRDGAELLEHRPVDHVGTVLADHLPVRRDGHDLEPVDLLELLGLRGRGARHPGQLAVHAEVVLERDRRQGLALAPHLDALLRLDGLMEPVRVTAPHHEAPRELVDDHDLPVLHDVVDVALEQAVGLQGLYDAVRQLGLRRVREEPRHPKEVLAALDSGLRDGDATLLLVCFIKWYFSMAEIRMAF